MRLMLSGIAWLIFGLAVIVVTRLVSGLWPVHGPFVVIWGSVLCGALRFAGGVISVRSALSSSTGSTNEQRRGRTGLFTDCALLGISTQASADELRAAYRERVKLWHPDHFMAHPELRERAEERLKAINAAYYRLADSTHGSPRETVRDVRSPS